MSLKRVTSIVVRDFTHFEVFLEESLVFYQFVVALHARRTDFAQLGLEEKANKFIRDSLFHNDRDAAYLLTVPPSLQFGYENLLTIVDGLLSDHNDSQLLS